MKKVFFFFFHWEKAIEKSHDTHVISETNCITCLIQYPYKKATGHLCQSQIVNFQQKKKDQNFFFHFFFLSLPFSLFLSFIHNPSLSPSDDYLSPHVITMPASVTSIVKCSEYILSSPFLSKIFVPASKLFVNLSGYRNLGLKYVLLNTAPYDFIFWFFFIIA